MKHLQQLVQSSLFLFGGLAILAISLHFTSVSETMASTGRGMASPVPQSFFDKQMPGSIPYLMNRARDRFALLDEQGSERVAYYLDFANHRISAAVYAFEQGDEELAVQTATKALGYLWRAQVLCQNLNSLDGSTESTQNAFQGVCQPFETQYLEQMHRLESSVQLFVAHSQNDALRAHSEHLLQRIEVVKK